MKNALGSLSLILLATGIYFSWNADTLKLGEMNAKDWNNLAFLSFFFATILAFAVLTGRILRFGLLLALFLVPYIFIDALFHHPAASALYMIVAGIFLLLRFLPLFFPFATLSLVYFITISTHGGEVSLKTALTQKISPPVSSKHISEKKRN